MAWATLAETVAVTVLPLANRPAPLCWPNLRAWRRIVTFGLTATSTIAIFRLRMTAPELIIGRMLGLEATGLFSRANGMAQIFNKLVVSAIEPVALPALAVELREGRTLKPSFLKKTEYIGALAWPSYAFLALMADPIVSCCPRRPMGRHVPIIQTLCLMGVSSPFSSLNAEFFIALGRRSASLRSNRWYFRSRSDWSPPASLHSVEAVALAIVVIRWANAILSNHYLAPRTRLHISRGCSGGPEAVGDPGGQLPPGRLSYGIWLRPIRVRPSRPPHHGGGGWMLPRLQRIIRCRTRYGCLPAAATGPREGALGQASFGLSTTAGPSEVGQRYFQWNGIPPSGG